MPEVTNRLCCGERPAARRNVPPLPEVILPDPVSEAPPETSSTLPCPRSISPNELIAIVPPALAIIATAPFAALVQAPATLNVTPAPMATRPERALRVLLGLV